MTVTHRRSTDGRKIIFAAVSDAPIHHLAAQEQQLLHGFHPAGYGFVGFSTWQENGRYHASWCCYASCE